MVVALSLASTASAARVTEAEMRGWLDELIPAVEEETGLTFRVRPTLQITDRAEAIRRAVASNAAAAGFGVPVGPPPQIPESFLAFYSPSDLGISVLRDAIEPIFARTDADDRLLAPFLRCAVLHELTHALQHQRAQVPLDRWEDPVTIALMEGQASIVARRRCGDPLAADFSDALMGADIVSSVPADHEQFAYTWGRRYVERLVVAGGQAAVWARFAAPPTLEELCAAVEPTLLPGWSDVEPLRTLAHELSPEGTLLEAGPMSPTEFLGASLGGGIDPAFIVHGEGGLAALVEARTTTSAVFLFRLTEPADATRWLEARRAGLQDRSLQVFSPDSRITAQWPFTRLPALADAGMEESLVVRFKVVTGRYREVWAARDGVLVGVTHYRRRGQHPDVVEALIALVESRRGPIPPIAPLEGADALVLPPPALAGRYALDRMLKAWRGGDLVGCSSIGEQLWAEVDATSQPPVLELGYHCALESGDAAVADAWLLYDAFRPPFDLAGPHLRRRYEAADWGGLLALVDRTAPADEDLRAHASLRLEALARLGRFDEAAALALSDLPEPDLRVFVAGRLREAGRPREAAGIAAAACPSASDEVRATRTCAP